MSILTGPEIKWQIGTGNITISPYDEKRVQPNSIDLTLGKEVCVYRDVVFIQRNARGYDEKQGSSYRQSKSLTPFQVQDLDVKRDNPVERFEMDESGWLLRPGILYLMHVVEELYAPNYVMTLDGKSSYARLGIIVHFTAGHAETGFSGQYTMEVSAMHPVRIYPGMPIAQVIFTTVDGKVQDYKTEGNYVGKSAMGAQPSRSWKHFLTPAPDDLGQALKAVPYTYPPEIVISVEQSVENPTSLLVTLGPRAHVSIELEAAIIQRVDLNRFLGTSIKVPEDKLMKAQITASVTQVIHYLRMTGILIFDALSDRWVLLDR